METLIYVLGILSGLVFCGLIYIFSEILKIHKRQKPMRENLDSLLKDYQDHKESFTAETSLSLSILDKKTSELKEEMEETLKKLNSQVQEALREEGEIYKKAVSILRDQSEKEISELKNLVAEQQASTRRYIDSRLDKTTRMLEISAGGVLNTVESRLENIETNIVNRVILRIEEDRIARNIERITEGIPVNGNF